MLYIYQKYTMKTHCLFPFKKSIIYLLLASCSFAMAQDDTDTSGFWENVRFGGGFGINFSNGFFSGSLSPSAIYDFNDYISIGPSLNLSYQEGRGFSTFLYGGSIVTLVNPIPNIQLSAEVEQLRVNQRITDNSDFEDNFWNTALFVGGGYRQNNITIGFRYNLLFKDGESIYTNAWAPFIRFYL